ncbi:MAG: hypothetical protein ACO20S_10600, partial [Paracoccaceae bacterium]
NSTKQIAKEKICLTIGASYGVRKRSSLWCPKIPMTLPDRRAGIGWDWTQSVSRAALSGFSVVGSAR